MAIFNMAGYGGKVEEAVGLNYAVVGGTSTPSTTVTNTIWVNTSTTITSHVFSATQPSGATGMVWIKIGTSSSVAFNALTENTITIYPVMVYQYVSGSWTKKDSKIYQGGAWVKFGSLYIYSKGTSTGYTFKCNESLKQLASGYSADASKVTIGSTNVKVANASLAYSFTNIFVTNSSKSFVKIDLSQYTKIRIKGTLTGATKDTACVFRAVTAFGELCTANNALTKVLYSGTLDTTISISSLTSSCYLGFTFYNEAATLTLTELWLE